jgi:hypothetical protein
MASGKPRFLKERRVFFVSGAQGDTPYLKFFKKLVCSGNPGFGVKSGKIEHAPVEWWRMFDVILKKWEILDHPTNHRTTVSEIVPANRRD